MEVRFDDLKIRYDNRSQERILGTSVDGQFQYGQYFPVLLNHRDFEIELLFITWDDEKQEIQSKIIQAPESLMPLHGRLRLSIRDITGGIYEGYKSVTLKRALLRSGTTLHANLFGTDRDCLDEVSGFDCYVTLENYGAIDVGKKSDVLGVEGKSRNELCCIYEPSDVIVPIVAFLLTRIYPLYQSWHYD